MRPILVKNLIYTQIMLVFSNEHISGMEKWGTGYMGKILSPVWLSGIHCLGWGTAFGNLWGLDTQCLSHITAWHSHDWCFPKFVLQTWFKDNYCKYFCTSIACFDSWRVDDSVLLTWLQLNWQTFLRSHLRSMVIHFELLRGYHEHGKHPTNGLFLQKQWMQIESPLSTAEFSDGNGAPCLCYISFACL